MLTTAVLTALIAASEMSAASDAKLEASVTAAMDHVEASLKKTEDAKLEKDFAEMIEPNRKRVAKARSATSPLIRLYRLRDAYIGAESLDFVREHRASGNDLDSFRAIWNQNRPRFEKKVPAKPGPFLQIALRQAAANKAVRLFHASLPYGKVSQPVYGLYYLAEAEGNLRFRDFIDSLSIGAVDTKAPKSAELEAAYNTLQDETLKFFALDPASRAPIAVSVRLKEARELLDQKTNEAATLALLETRLTLSRQQASKTDAPAGAEKQSDNSLLSFWQDLANEEEPDVSRYIRRDVLPLYTTLMRSGS